ncbi:S1-like domain-containing RNA-binding protein [Alteromonas ponticola]|uniref:S1-like domain-containing RNA-binding protein n=1 Tax=Alteromonas aquimaris TaxID=2998417 RepID=A0ABT3P7G1_9ALTE|nr:S1-like domain-containing RNA-binding protein [Alteromonas aquimaris]MCW8108680.1 S1-like domain-containing RNA-binding protein [Alteromonas aquimaris]
MNRLTVSAELPFGFHLSTPEEADRLVTLMIEDAPANIKQGDEVDVFVGTDEHGELIAFPTAPRVMLDEAAVLTAVSVTDFGAFFDWGLAKDLLVKPRQQEFPIHQGMRCLVHVYLDEQTGRIMGATRLHPFYQEQNHYLKEGDEVRCQVYAKTPLGYKILINQNCLGLIFQSDAFKPLQIGDETAGFIKTIREDGKIDVALQPKLHKGRASLEQQILDDLDAHGGFSTITDKSPADDIYKRFNVSKGAYKKALGSLYKQRRITINPNMIKLNQETAKK